MLREALAIGVRRVIFLALRRVEQDDLAQLAGGFGAVHPALEPLLYDPRQKADVIEMRMCEHHDVKRLHIEWRRRPIELAELLQALKQAAVDEYLLAGRFEQILGASNGASRAVEGDAWHAS
jgi:hypothetical protein